MGNLLLWIGRLGGILGVLVSAGAVVARYRGTYNVGGFQVGTLLLAGIAAMVVGCLGYLAFMAERAGK
jgi:ribosomal protein L27